MTAVATPPERVRGRAEVSGYRDMWAAAPPDLAERHGVAARDLDGGVLLACAALPSSRMLNHALGLGLDGPVDLDAVEAFYAEAGAPCAVAVDDTADGLRAGLEARGFREDRPWATFHRPAGPVDAPATSLRVTGTDATTASAFGGVVAAGFGMPPEFSAWVAALVGRPSWTCLLAWDGPTPVGAAALHLRGDSAWFALGATLPEHRGKGAQGALFAARAAVASAAGARHFVTETGAPLPGDGPGPSHRNMLRAGFAEAALRPNLVSPGMP
ncbi:MAG: GNAT family N-acetyltransferase [Thermoleophilia bacterium]